jgi:hypothetical protein
VDPDVFITIAFTGYAVLVCLGIGIALLGASGRQVGGSRSDARWAVVKPHELGSAADGLNASEPQA